MNPKNVIQEQQQILCLEIFFFLKKMTEVIKNILKIVYKRN